MRKWKKPHRIQALQLPTALVNLPGGYVHLLLPLLLLLLLLLLLPLVEAEEEAPWLVDVKEEV